MLWDIIRDFFVQYIWGGYDSLGNFHTLYYGQFATSDFTYEGLHAEDLFVPIGKSLDWNSDLFVEYMCLPDWLSTTSTIIVLILMCVFLYVFIRWAFRLTAGLFQGR